MMPSAISSNARSLIRTLIYFLPMKGPIFGAVRRFVRLPERVYRHLHFRGPFTVEIDAGQRFHMYHWGNQIENDIFWAGLGNNLEATSVRLWLRFAANAEMVLDIGANTGVFALSAQAINPDAKVFAFEPVARIHARLTDNIELNRYNINAVRAGASNLTGKAALFDLPSEHVYSASLDREMLSGQEDLIQTVVDVIRTDDFLLDELSDESLLVKIDVERHELQVLEGFGDLIRTRTPTFLVEILDRTIGEKVEKFFAGLDFAFYEIREGAGIYPVHVLGTAERNYLICPRRIADELRFSAGLSHEDLSRGRALQTSERNAW